jgi:hypothetical protein
MWHRCSWSPHCFNYKLTKTQKDWVTCWRKHSEPKVHCLQRMGNGTPVSLSIKPRTQQLHFSVVTLLRLILWPSTIRNLCETELTPNIFPHLGPGSKMCGQVIGKLSLPCLPSWEGLCRFRPAPSPSPPFSLGVKVITVEPTDAVGRATVLANRSLLGRLQIHL